MFRKVQLPTGNAPEGEQQMFHFMTLEWMCIAQEFSILFYNK